MSMSVRLFPGLQMSPEAIRQMVTDRTILVDAFICTELVEGWLAAIDQMVADNSHGLITVLINSSGGMVEPAFELCSKLRQIQDAGTPVIARVIGRADSAALFILLSANIREGYPDSRFHMHNPHYAVLTDDPKEAFAIMIERLPEIFAQQRQAFELVRNRIGMAKEQFIALCAEDRSLCANCALNLKFIQRII